jgi:hypothetical protein
MISFRLMLLFECFQRDAPNLSIVISPFVLLEELSVPWGGR